MDPLCVECSEKECTKCTVDGLPTGKEIKVISLTKLCTCASGEYSNSGGTCTTCTDTNCKICFDNVCSECKSGYYLDGAAAC